MALPILFRRASRLPSHFLAPSRCLFSTSPITRSAETSAPVLSNLRNDMKTAMRNKDTARLSVIRAVLADITNASKTSNPVTTDLQLLSILKKRVAASQTAVNEFKEAGREDLVEKESAQIQVLEGYTSDLQGDMMGEAEVRAAVEKVIEGLQQGAQKIGMGDVVKKVLGPGGSLEGRMVDKKGVARMIQELLNGKK